MSMISRRTVLRVAAAGATLWALPTRGAARFSRIVSLDYALASTLLSLGAAPAGVASLADWDKWVIDPPMPGGVVDIGSSWEVNFELLSDLKPDLILTTPYLDALKPKLEQLAPVLSIPVYTGDGAPVLPRAYAATRELGAFIGLEREAAAFLRQADETFAACRTRVGNTDRPPVVLVNLMDARHARIFGAPGLYQGVLDRLGVRNAWIGTGNYWGFQTVGIEELARFHEAGTRLFAFEPVPRNVMPKLARSPLWRGLPFAQPGHFAVLPGVLMFGMVREAVRFAELITASLEAAP